MGSDRQRARVVERRGESVDQCVGWSRSFNCVLAACLAAVGSCAHLVDACERPTGSCFEVVDTWLMALGS